MTYLLTYLYGIHRVCISTERCFISSISFALFYSLKLTTPLALWWAEQLHKLPLIWSQSPSCVFPHIHWLVPRSACCVINCSFVSRRDHFCHRYISCISLACTVLCLFLYAVHATDEFVYSACCLPHKHYVCPLRPSLASLLVQTGSVRQVMHEKLDWWKKTSVSPSVSATVQSHDCSLWKSASQGDWMLSADFCSGIVASYLMSCLDAGK